VKRVHLLVWGVLLAASAGCAVDAGGAPSALFDGKDQGDDGLFGGKATSEGYCAGWVETISDFYDRCLQEPLTDAEAEDARGSCARYVERALEAGAVQWNPGAAGLCAQAVQTSCDFDVFTEGTCAEVFEGRLGEGARCFADQECDQGYCTHVEICPGACQGWALAGESCAERWCAPGTFCNDALHCQAELAVGEPCDGYGCGPGLSCGAPLPGFAQACRKDPPEAKEGEPCDSARLCALPLFCQTLVGGVFGDGGTCRRPAEPGARCAAGGEDLEWFFWGCRASICQVESGEVQGVCVATREGAACVESSFLVAGQVETVQGCRGGLECDLEMGVCVPWTAAGLPVCERP